MLIRRVVTSVAVVCFLLMLTGVTMVGLRFAKAAVAGDVYLKRLQQLEQDYGTLQERYNSAVRAAALTELRVNETSAQLWVRGSDGAVHHFQTPYKAGDVVNFEYVVWHGRVLIYGVYDRNTSPNDGTRIDPEQRLIDWSDASEPYTLAIGRKLTPGRWVVRMSGNGALTLAQADEQELVELEAPPSLERYDPIEREIEDATREVGLGEVFRRLLRGDGAGS